MRRASTLSCSAGDDPQTAEREAARAADRIKKLFKSRYMIRNDHSADVWQSIEVQSVLAVSDDSLSFALSQQLTRWHSDQFSLRADP
jgi:hypothetical protein